MKLFFPLSFLTLKGLSSSSGMLWSPYWARSFSPLLSNLAAASSTLVNQEQNRSADGWKLCNDAIPEFKSLPLEETPELRLSYLGTQRKSHLTVRPYQIRKKEFLFSFLFFFSVSWSSYKVQRCEYIYLLFISSVRDLSLFASSSGYEATSDWVRSFKSSICALYWWISVWKFCIR